MIKKTIYILFFILAVYTLSCDDNSVKSNNPEEQNKDNTYRIWGKMYTLQNNKKRYRKDIKVLLNSDSSFTDRSGTFSFDNLHPGNYRLTIEDSVYVAETYEFILENQDLYREINLFIPNQPPTANFDISFANNTYLFDASLCFDPEDKIEDLQVRWDWENDGIWDTEFSINKYEEHQFVDTTIYSIKLEVMDSGGLTDTLVQNNVVSSTLEDIDGNIYKTVKIGSQWWMAENLRTTRYQNGDSINEFSNNIAWDSLKGGIFGINKVNNEYFYNQYAKEDSRKIAPKGWHVSTQSDWEFLFKIAEPNIGKKLKSQTGWENGGNGTDDFGFCILPSGGFYAPKGFKYHNKYSYFWNDKSYVFYFNCWNNNVYECSSGREVMNSIRCVKDVEE